MFIGDWSVEFGWRFGILLVWMEEVMVIFVVSDDMVFGILCVLVD